MVAEHLGVPHATAMSSMTISTDAVRGERAGDDETVSIAASLPAVASITERMPDARFPTFKGTMSAKKKPLETLSVADLSTELGDRLEASARSTVIDIRQRPARAAGTKVMDDGSAADRLIDFLAAQRLI
jgi:electron transfer flavoprotein beta subunit